MMSTNSAASLLSPAVILEKIAAITLQIQQCQPLEDILQGVLADARLLLQTDWVLLGRCLEPQETIVAFESVRAERPSLLGQRLAGLCSASLWSARDQRGQVTMSADVQEGMLDACAQQPLEALTVKAQLDLQS